MGNLLIDKIELKMNTRVSQMFGVGIDVEVRRINMQLQMQI